MVATTVVMDWEAMLPHAGSGQKNSTNLKRPLLISCGVQSKKRLLFTATFEQIRGIVNSGFKRWGKVSEEVTHNDNTRINLYHRLSQKE